MQRIDIHGITPSDFVTKTISDCVDLVNEW